MKKRLTTAGICIVLGIAMLFSAVYANGISADGYDVYKEALKNTAHAENVTAAIHMEFTDNGKTVAEMDSVTKAAHGDIAAFSSTMNIKAEGEEKTIESYVQDNQMVTKISDDNTYYVHNSENKRMHRKEASGPADKEKAEKFGEIIMDAMVGEMKNNFLLEDGQNGSRTVSLELSENQIPAVVNSLVSLAASEEGNKHHEGSKHFGADMDVELPKLVEDVAVKSFVMNAEITSEQTLENQTMTVVLSGKDETGLEHDVTFSYDMELSGLNATTPDTIDLSGKEVKEIEDRDEQ